jgi:hypothetical protein
MNIRPRYVLAGLLLAVVLSLGIVFYHQWQHYVSYETGSYNVSGALHNNAAFSGSLSDVSELAIIGVLARSSYQHYKATKCHHEGCRRIGLLPVGNYRVCHKHHLEATGTTVTMDHLKATHKQVLDNQKHSS